MKEKGYIGLDVGTSGCKAAVVSEEGTILASASRNYSFICPQPGYIELNPDLVWAKVKEVLAEIAFQKLDVQTIAVSSIGETIVCLDKNDRVLRNGITYLDERGQDTVDQIARMVDPKEMYRITGLPLRFFYSLNRLLWMQQEEKDILSGTDKFFLFGDFITYRLSGERIIDPSTASKTYLLDVNAGRWSETLGNLFGIPLDRFSMIAPAGTSVGKILPSLAEELGLPPDLQVLVGCHDQCAATLGAVGTSPGCLLAGEGSTESLNLIVNRSELTDRIFQRELVMEPYVREDEFIIPSAQHTHGTSIRWFLEQIRAEKTDGHDPYERAEQTCAEECGELFFVPHLSRAHLLDPENRSLGGFVGIDLGTDHTKMYRALLEGLCFETRMCFDALREAGGQIRQIAAGGGCTRSEQLMQLKADILETPLTTLRYPDPGILALGMIGTVHKRCYRSLEEAAGHMLQPGRTYVPKTDYRKKYERYIEIYNAMKALYAL